MPQPSQSRTHAVAPLTSAAADTITALHQLARDLGARPELNDALARALRTAAQLTASPHATLLLLDGAGEQISYRIALDNGNLAPLELVARPMMQRGLAGWVVRERRSALVRDTAHDARWLPGPGLGDLRSALVVPLLHGGQVLGVLTLGHEAPFHYQPEHLSLAEIISSQAAATLALTRLGDAPPAPGPSAARMVVLAAELRGLSAATGAVPPALALSEVIGAFFQAAAAAIDPYGDSIATMSGDGLLAVFPGTAGPAGAAQAARALAHATRQLRAQWQARFGIRPGALHLGIAEGAVLLGVLPTNPPATHLSGSAADQARRLCALAYDDILLDQPLAQALATHPEFMLQALPPFHTEHGAPQHVFQLGAHQPAEATAPSQPVQPTPGLPC